jgi:hypothetical protein
MKGFSVTFERYLPLKDDVEICEPDEIGFVVQNVTLREAMRDGLEYCSPRACGVCEPNCYPPRDIRWLTFYTWNDCTREQIEQGINESRSLHIPDAVTESSRMRVARLFGAIK